MYYPYGFLRSRAFRRILNTIRWFQLPVSLRKTIREVRATSITYLSRRRLAAIAQICQDHEQLQIPGVIIEVGCALGGSTVVIAAAKNKHRRFLVYDVFEMIPPPSNEDGIDAHRRYKTIRGGKSKGIGPDVYYGYQENLFEKVQANFRRFKISPDENHVKFIKGLIQDTLDVRWAVSLAHIDVDWYEPVMVSLKRIVPKLSVGGVIVVDDYNDWSGARKAVDEYFGQRSGMYSFDSSTGSLVIRKQN